MDGKILGVGTLDEVKGWVTDEEVEIDQAFRDAVIIPGLIEAHMHPQITGVLWLGRLCRPVRPDGARRNFGQGAGDQAGRSRPAQGRGCQTAGRREAGWSAGAISRSSTPTRRSPAPISIRSPTAIRSSSRICRCISTTPTARRSRSPASATTPTSSASSRRTASRPARSRRSRLPLLSPRNFRRSMPRRCSRRPGTPPSSPIASASRPLPISPSAASGRLPGLSGRPPPIRISRCASSSIRSSKSSISPEVAAKGGLDVLTEWHKADTDRLSFGGVKFVVDGSIQGYTGLFQWPDYYKTFANGVANITQDELTKGVTEVHKRGFQAVIHTNADEATEMALTALTEAQRNTRSRQPGIGSSTINT